MIYAVSIPLNKKAILPCIMETVVATTSLAILTAACPPVGAVAAGAWYVGHWIRRANVSAHQAQETQRQQAMQEYVVSVEACRRQQVIQAEISRRQQAMQDDMRLLHEIAGF